ncbi:hypothetical protein [Denitratisoma oestradiolicum]|uniref:DUF4760 domain-containing protein n=1 Tax=Denitratisoma oestradiolicum TaxID=311182 RepID=A0A6S6XTT5_9PROT|nr:hypothetical protein [Denitratisoma oestradiolicum]TWO79451.1 hypothetical protein CBW56_15040 [Denitratisoma oestradiolicum]CAB1368165.1 conserved protein of unknown function [Denitratisoma oestradiolicum]
MNLQDWANLATIAGSIAIFGIALQVYIAHRQLKADHERSRREKSVEILMEWSRNLKKEGSVARKIIECLNEEQCRDIFAQQEVKISRKHENLLAQLFGDKIQTKEGNDHILLTEAQSTELRWHAVSYLNSLEFTLVAWQYSVVDKEIIETQFSYLFRPADGHEVLKYFRKAAGGENSFPAIEIFTAHLSKKRRDQLISKANVA